MSPIFLLLAIGCVLTAVQPQPVFAQGSATPAVVSVGGRPIYASDYMAALRRAGLDTTAMADHEAYARAELLEKLVDARLLRNEIENRKIVVDDREVATVVQQLLRQLAASNLTLEEYLARANKDEKTLRDEVSLEVGLNKLLRPRLTDAIMEAAFLKHRRELDGTQLRASHIVLRPDPGRGTEAIPAAVKDANTIRRDIVQAEISFAEAARKYSAGPSRRRDGDIGFFPRHGAMTDEFAKAAFALAKGDVSKPVVTTFGVHLIMVTEVAQGDAGAEQLRPQLEKIVAQDLLRETLARARAETDIVYAPGVLHFDPATPVGDPAARRIIMNSEP